MFDNRHDFKSAVVGMVYGDGYIGNNGGRENHRLIIHHSNKQKEYAEWKAELLGYLTKVSVRETEQTRKDDGKRNFPLVQKSVFVQTGRHPFYSSLHERAYKCGRKVIDDHLLKIMSPLGLAIWYMDDGCLSRSSKDTSSHLLYIATMCFSKPEIDLVIYRFYEKWGFRFQLVDKRKGLIGTRKWNVATRFLEIVEPFIHPTMSYKVKRTASPTGKNLMPVG